MHIFDELLSDIQIPQFRRIRVSFNEQCIEDIPAEIARRLTDSGVDKRITPGMRVCIAAGSRDIGEHALIVKTIVDYVYALNASPFIIPAMGSHGGATAQGQQEVLESFGITQETMGAPVLSSMETVEITQTLDGQSVQMDKYAADADFIIPVSRIKPHTDFRGRVESGMCKMLTIGLGKQHGAYICHKRGFPNMPDTVWAVSSAIAEVKKNIVVLGIVENAFHKACHIVATPIEKVHSEEPILLEEAKRRIARFPFLKADVLVVDEFGKDISGAGMDPNITGRSVLLPRAEPYFANIVVRDLTDATHGNVGGIGNADVIPRRVFDKISFEASYPNAITAADARGTMIPIVMPNDRLALQFAIRASIPSMGDEAPRVIWIQNTLKLSEYYISESLVALAKTLPDVEVIDEAPMRALFGNEGEFKGFA